MKRTIMKKTLISMLPVLLAPAVTHAANPWLPEAGRWNVGLSYSQQSADELYAGDQRADLPADLDQSTLLVNISYAPNYVLALDFTTGYAKSEFISVPGLSPDDELDGVQDVRLGARYLLRDEVVTEDLSVTLGAAVIIAGDYDTGALNAIGDGANGLEGSVSLGRQFGNGLALAGDLGYRYRDEDVPNEWFGSLDAIYAFTDRISARVGYSMANATSGLDIGGPGFSPARFPEVEEDFQLASAGVNVAFSSAMSLALDVGQKFDGRNTSRSQIWGLTFRFAW
jgi:hypothetical protein